MPCSPLGLGPPVHTTTPILYLLPVFHPLPSRRKGKRFGGHSKDRGEQLHSLTASQCHVLATDCQSGCAHGHSRAGVCRELLTLPWPHQHRQGTARGRGAAPVLGACSPQHPPLCCHWRRHPRAWCHHVCQAQSLCKAPNSSRIWILLVDPSKAGAPQTSPLLPRWSEHL